MSFLALSAGFLRCCVKFKVVSFKCHTHNDKKTQFFSSFFAFLSIFVHLFGVVWRRELPLVRLRGVHTDSEFKAIWGHSFSTGGSDCDQLDTAVEKEQYRI